MYCCQFSKFSFFSRPPSNRAVVTRIKGPNITDCSRTDTGEISIRRYDTHHLGLTLSDSRVMWPLPGSPRRERWNECAPFFSRGHLSRPDTGVSIDEGVCVISRTWVASPLPPFCPRPIGNPWLPRLEAYINVMWVEHLVLTRELPGQS